jgi:hypothetical protein
VTELVRRIERNAERVAALATMSICRRKNCRKRPTPRSLPERFSSEWKLIGPCPTCASQSPARDELLTMNAFAGLIFPMPHLVIMGKRAFLEIKDRSSEDSLPSNGGQRS